MRVNDTELSYNVLLKIEDELCIAHCLELDLVHASENAKDALKGLFDVIFAQVSFAFEHDNVENLYKPAPAEVWQEYFKAASEKCKISVKRKHLPKQKSQATRVFPDFISTRILEQGACFI